VKKNILTQIVATFRPVCRGDRPGRPGAPDPLGGERAVLAGQRHVRLGPDLLPGQVGLAWQPITAKKPVAT
jgi:hypothetical protein